MNKKYNPEINALRGLAILLTLAAHWWAGMLNAGDTFNRISEWAQFWPGVYLFFVISGYVITLNFYERLSAASDRSAAIQFYKRRFFRLTPAAFTWIAITLAIALWLP